MMRNYGGDIGKRYKQNFKHGFLLHCVIMLILVVIIFGQYLFGQKLFVFTDVATDSAGQTYPNLVYLAREISAGNTMNRWNFSSSIGNSAEMILPKLSNLETYFGVENVAYLMGFNMALKVFLSGIFFYLYLKKMGISNSTSSIFAIFYAFCAQIIIRGSWRSYPNEVLMFSIWLYAFESWFDERNKWWKLLFASVFLYYNSSGYYVVLYTGIFLAYSVFRLVEEWDKDKIKFQVKQILTFVGIVFCALLFSMISWISNISVQLKSERFVSGIEKIPSFGISDLFTGFDALKTAFYRTIGTDILGISEYYGTSNFLEAPAFYCGLLTFILLPVIYIQAKGKKKMAYSIGLVGIILYIFVKPVRYIANGMSGYSFKLSSLWVMVLMLYIVAKNFDLLLKRKGNSKKNIILVTGICVSILAIAGAIDGINWIKLCGTIGFIALYIIILFLFDYEKINRFQVNISVLCIVLAEVFFTSFGCINNRETMDKDRYEDGTIEALNFINSNNESKDVFYRIDKNYQALSYCDALYQGYMGTVGYIGGSGDRRSTGEFYDAVAMSILGGNNHVMTGFWSSTAVNTVMNVKYILSKAGMHTNFGYKKIGEIEGISVYENQYALPLGYVYDKYITMDEYLKLPVEIRRNILLDTCVLKEENDSSEFSPEISEMSMLELETFETSSEMEITENWVKLELPQSTDGEVNIVVMDVTSNGIKSSMIEYYNQDGDAVTSYLGFADGRDKYFLEFNDPQIARIQIFNTKQYDIEQIKVYQLPQEVYYKKYMDNHETLSRNGLNVERMDCNNIWGTINSSIDGLMTFSIPYDTNWHVYVDGVEQELKTVNIAMMGTDITKGLHEIRLVYYKSNEWLKHLLLGGIVLFIFLMVNKIWIVVKKDKNMV